MLFSSSVDLPVFADALLTTPSVLHAMNCPSRLSVEAEDLSCSCGSAVDRIPAQAHLQQVESQGLATRVRYGGREGWVETVPFRPVSSAPAVSAPVEPRPTPADFVLVDARLSRGALPYRRRRKEPVPGDLVFRRSEWKAGPKPHAWRLFAIEHEAVFLMSPAFLPETLLTLQWGDLLREPLLGKTPGSILLTIFPLPDGTESPGGFFEP